MNTMGRNQPPADRRPWDRGPISLDEARRLEAQARHLQGDAIAATVRGAVALLVGAVRAVLRFVRCAAAGQAKRAPRPADCW